MPLTFLLVAGVVLAVTTRSVLTSSSADQAALVEPPADRVIDPAADTLAGSVTQTPGPAAPTDWQLMTVSSLRDAEQLLDWLEAHGYADRELVVLGKSSFAVRWR